MLKKFIEKALTEPIKEPIKKMLCKAGLHKYEMKQFSLSNSIATRVNCKWCKVSLREEQDKEWQKRKEEIMKDDCLP